MNKAASSTENGFVFVVKSDQLKLNTPATFEVDDRFIVIVKNDDGVFCIDDVCTHDGGTLGDGEYADNCLVCPRHGAKFDVKTGDAVAMPATEPTVSHEVKIDGDDVLVRLAS
jgi:3-phenylpropionate/trans-cinnamate dioxygenase ferredoxin component